MDDTPATNDQVTGTHLGRPALPVAEWETTRNTLHLWTQVVGKVRLARTPLVNHWWNVTLYVTARASRRRSYPTAPAAVSRSISTSRRTSSRSPPPTAAEER